MYDSFHFIHEASETNARPTPSLASASHHATALVQWRAESTLFSRDANAPQIALDDGRSAMFSFGLVWWIVHEMAVSSSAAGRKPFNIECQPSFQPSLVFQSLATKGNRQNFLLLAPPSRSFRRRDVSVRLTDRESIVASWDMAFLQSQVGNWRREKRDQNRTEQETPTHDTTPHRPRSIAASRLELADNFSSLFCHFVLCELRGETAAGSC